MIRRFIAIVFAVCINPVVLAEDVGSKDPVKHIGIYVIPYYEAAETPNGKPRVAVAKAYDATVSLE